MADKEEIRKAYRAVGKSSNFYDSMMTGTSLPGRAILRGVWDMSREEALEYQAGALAAVPADFSGKLLEVPVGTGVLSLPVWKTLPQADITCLDYSGQMMDAARRRAEEYGIENVKFVQGDVGDLPYEDNTFDLVVSLNGFHAFPDKEAAYRETYRVLKPGGIFCGCFYIEKGCAKTDFWIRRVYIPAGFFTPPFETEESLRRRLQNMYSSAEVKTVRSIAYFKCIR